MPCGGAARILPLYSLHIIKGDKKGRSGESEKSLLCILSYKDRARRYVRDMGAKLGLDDVQHSLV